MTIPKIYYPTEAKINEVEAAVFDLIVECYRQQGYTISDEGYIIPKIDGVDAPEFATTRYAIPEQESDGRWSIPDPEQHPEANYMMLNNFSLYENIVSLLMTFEEV